jgi:predicted phosphate transport protein (TIGR00153 family)
MSKKSEMFYFNNLVESAGISCEAAYKLKEILTGFDPDTVSAKLDEIHEIENRGDEKKHEMISEVAKAFITPIERDDLIKISQNIDNVTDSIEDVVLVLYETNVTKLRDNALTFVDLIIQCCEKTVTMLNELSDFKKSKEIKNLIIEVNHLEEEGDKLYISYTRDLCVKEKDPMIVMSWYEIYRAFESICDSCEDVAEVVESIIIANS